MDSNSVVRVGTRRSALALKQVDIVVADIKKHHPSVTFEILPMATAGDKDQTSALSTMGKGLWTNELEARLAAGHVDMIIHSLKDMPTTLPPAMALAAVTAREDSRDVVVFKSIPTYAPYQSLSDLPAGSVVGTSSVRRAAQLRRRYPGLVIRDIRGNIETRLHKLDTQPYDCVILAAAGLLRMGYACRIAQYLDSSSTASGTLSAVGQGALGIEIRAGDNCMAALLACITHRPTLLATAAERSLMRTLEGGCSVPIGAETSWEDDDKRSKGESNKKLRLKAVVVSLDGQDGVDGDLSDKVTTVEEAEEFGRRMARELVDKGAQKILDEINAGRPAGRGGAIKLADTQPQATP